MTDFTSDLFSRPVLPGASLLRTVRLWVEAARERKALRSMPYSRLEDLGLSPRDADAEAARPFWDVRGRR